MFAGAIKSKETFLAFLDNISVIIILFYQNGWTAFSTANNEMKISFLGPERKSAVIEEENRTLVAYHESGHAIVALYTPSN